MILSIGQSIEWGGLLEGSKVELNRNNTAVADAVTLQTGEEDIFVGGDVYTGPRFAIDAIAAGKEASVSMHRFVHKGHSLTLSRDRRQFIELDKITSKLRLSTMQNVRYRARNQEYLKTPSVTSEAPLLRSRSRQRQHVA